MLAGTLVAVAVRPLLPPDLPDLALLVGPALGIWIGVQLRAAWVGARCRELLRLRLAPRGVQLDHRWERFADSLLVTLAVEGGYLSGPWAMTSPEFESLYELAAEAAGRCIVPLRPNRVSTVPGLERRIARLQEVVQPLLAAEGLLRG